MLNWQTNRIARKIKLAQLALLFESLWAALLWPLLICGALLAVLLFGLFDLLPVHYRLIVAGLIGLVLVFSLRPLFKIRWPATSAAMRRIEQHSALKHRPLSELQDHLSTRQTDPASQALWQLHKQQQLAQLAHLSVGNLQSRWRDRDPMAWRVPVAMALLAALLFRPFDPVTTLGNLFTTPIINLATTQHLDAWLKPPAYTGKPPRLLSSPSANLAPADPIATPENSILTLRLTDAKNPKLTLLDAQGKPIIPPAMPAAPASPTTAPFVSEVKITQSLTAILEDGGETLATWHITAIPDLAPSIAIVEPPSASSAGLLKLKWQTADDYGVTSLSPNIALADEQADGVGFNGNGVFLFEPPDFPITLNTPPPRDQIGSSTADLASHPWAGLMVDLTLEAKDAAGHTTTSRVQKLKLPERIFINPLGQALIEQRKTLIMEPDQAGDVAEQLHALLLYPKGLISHSATHLTLAVIAAQLDRAETHDEVKQAIADLWQLALQLETGQDSSALAALEAAKKALADAMRRGETPERLAELTEKYKSAMQNYLQSLQRNADEGGAPQLGAQEQMISPDDLQKMLDMIDKLNRQGKTAEAEKLLQQLNDLLKNLKMSRKAGGPGGRGGGQGGESQDEALLKDLGELLKKQQKLMDQTQRQQSGAEQPREQSSPNAPTPNTPAPGAQGSGEQGSGEQTAPTSPENLAEQQRKLRDDLQKLQNRIGENGLKTPEAFGDAGKTMGEAEQSLKQDDTEQALQQQNQTMQSLREGAKNLSRAMREQAQNGEQGEGNNQDPLGRKGTEAGNGNQNSETAEQDLSKGPALRAGEILNSLRQRLNLPDLPPSDKSYIERLLDGLK